jgi:hypothetical protein
MNEQEAKQRFEQWLLGEVQAPNARVRARLEEIWCIR